MAMTTPLFRSPPIGWRLAVALARPVVGVLILVTNAES
jgi:hypothetical protein